MAPDGTVTILHSFPGFQNDGESPIGSLVMDKKGNIYGTTVAGGTSGNGTVFRLAPNGKETVLYSFGTGSDGAEPFAGVVRDKAGNFYGTTFLGGASGNGTVYKVVPDGSETVLHSFAGDDGSAPFAGLIIDSAGNLCGTTARGGANSDGTVFRIAPDGSFETLYTFAGDDGAAPYGGLIEQKPGVYYGTTGEGGTYQSGVVYRLTGKGKEQVLYTFEGRQRRCLSVGDLTPGPMTPSMEQRNMAATTGRTAASTAAAAASSIGSRAMAGKQKVLHAFTNGTDGGNPEAAFAMDQNGILYGTAAFGGADNEGVVFRDRIADAFGTISPKSSDALYRQGRNLDGC